ncbi:hypothetical protein SAMN05421819_0110 [Bryocella elongata]|uniref:Uncharacterized protein n=1 Tax=Bryocella elongata TaxID=863522 RepID=A0A1H5S8C6_9BACT|nr:hypothetical protein [Bryocella elongata]SEF46853.1 hypothetical protein SAMN05421819_0110 [Bryocella elongata]
MRVPMDRRLGLPNAGGWEFLVQRAALLGAVLGIVFGAQEIQAADRQAVVATRVPLESIGVNGVSPAQLNAGASMLTVHFLDDTHLLVTYGTHGLVRRLENDPKDDQDRIVAMEIVELPSGKVIAKEEWQAHDHERYLWNLGRGRFVIRTGWEFYAIEPMAHLASGQPFSRAQIKAFQKPSLLLVSPDQNVITVESRVRVKRANEEWGDAPPGNVPVTMLVEFYRLRGSGDNPKFSMELSGRVLTPRPLFLPLTGDGALYAEPPGRDRRWPVNFVPFGGKPIKAAEVESTCDPQLQMVSPSEFLALTCRGVNDATVLKAYAFDGHEAWEEPLSGMDDPVYATAPEAGRFAVLRHLDSAPGSITSGTDAPVDRQELRVYQTESGDMLLKVDLFPAFKSAENFDLSRDGSLAVGVRDRALVVYKLPEPDKQDRADMAMAAKSAPPVVNAGPIRLPAAVETASLEGPGGGSAAAKAADAAARPAQASKADRTESAAVAAPAQQPVARRVAPTLMKPGEKPEFGKANPQPADDGSSGDLPH